MGIDVQAAARALNHGDAPHPPAPDAARAGVARRGAHWRCERVSVTELAGSSAAFVGAILVWGCSTGTAEAPFDYLIQPVSETSTITPSGPVYLTSTLCLRSPGITPSACSTSCRRVEPAAASFS